jgi:hypothetical protein
MHNKKDTTFYQKTQQPVSIYLKNLQALLNMYGGGYA